MEECNYYFESLALDYSYYKYYRANCNKANCNLVAEEMASYYLLEI